MSTANTHTHVTTAQQCGEHRVVTGLRAWFVREIAVRLSKEIFFYSPKYPD